MSPPSLSSMLVYQLCNDSDAWYDCEFIAKLLANASGSASNARARGGCRAVPV